MADITIQFDRAKLDALFSRLDRVAAASVVVPPITRGVNTLRADLANYPPQSHRPNPPKSEKQRRFLRMLGAKGLIPYRRTGNLGRSWVEEVKVTATGVEGTVGNNAVSPTGTHYGPFVQGGGQQSDYFQGSDWPTDQRVFDANQKDIIDDITKALNQALG